MDRLTTEAVAKHAEAWPNWAGAPGALWRVTKSGVLPRFVILGVRVGAMPVEDLRPGEKGTIWVWDPILAGPWRILGDDDYAGWSITPVRPDGSDLPDERAMERLQAILGERPESLASGVHALISKFANQRIDMLIGATAEARRKGAEQQRSAIVAVLRDEYDDSIADDFEAGMWDDRLTGEWSAKP